MLTLDRVTVRAGPFRLTDVSWEVRDGEHAVLMGRTGCGKTTLLEAVCGLRRIEAGRVSLHGIDVTAWPPARRGIGLVPQDGALFSSLTVREHLGFALAIRRQPRTEVARRVAELADWLGLAPLLDRRPAGLSGGEVQRVALGRALAFQPKLLCLDEPLSALDEDTRLEVGELLRSIRQRTGVTIVHITHNRDEARRLADRTFILRDGRIAETHAAPA